MRLMGWTITFWTFWLGLYAPDILLAVEAVDTGTGTTLGTDLAEMREKKSGGKIEFVDKTKE